MLSQIWNEDDAEEMVNSAHQSDHCPVRSIEHAWSTTGRGQATRWRATSCSDRSYISLESELFLRILLNTHKSWLPPFTGFGSCVPHLKVVWLDVCLQVDWNRFPDFVCSNTCSPDQQFVSTPPLLLGWKVNERPISDFGKERRTDLHQNRS